MSQKEKGMVGRNSNYSKLVSHRHCYFKHNLTTFLIYFSNPNGKFSKYQNNDWNTLYCGRHGQRGEISWIFCLKWLSLFFLLQFVLSILIF